MKMMISVMLTASLASAAPGMAQSADDGISRIAVMSAFAPEWVALQAALEDRSDTVINGTTFATGSIEGKPVVLFLTGVSMVNAAMTSQLVIDHFDVDRIVFSGIAGGVDPSRHIGDVIVPSQWGQYQEMLFARDVDGTFTAPGFMSTPYPSFGMMFPQDVEVAREGSEPEGRFWFPADPGMLEIASAVASSISLEDCAPENACLTHAPTVTVGGNGVSGQTFVDNAEFREWAFETFDAEVLDMESAAVAHVAYANRVPFIAFRSLSDLAGGGEGENEMGTFMQLASNNSAAVVKAFLAALPE